MANYRLELDGVGFEVAPGRISPIRLARTPDGGSTFEFVLLGSDLVGRAGLQTRIRFFCEGELVFAGRLFEEETFVRTDGRGKRILAAGPMNLSELVPVTNAAGVPQMTFSQTTVGEILLELFTRQGEAMRKLGVAGETFFVPADIQALSAPVDYLWLENRDFRSAFDEVLTFGDYLAFVQPESLAWQIVSAEELPTIRLDFRQGSDWSVSSFSVKSSLADRSSAVRLVSEGAVGIAYERAVPAWDASLEESWQLRHAMYENPDSERPSDLAWVYRRFSYADIAHLLDSQPVELVVKVPLENGGWTYRLLETLPPDREAKTLTAKYPVLVGPTAKGRNGRNPIPAGNVQPAEAFIRYRYAKDSPTLSARYPASGFAGQVLETAGLQREATIYESDSRRINTDRARLYWKRLSRVEQQVELSLAGPISCELLRQPYRVQLISDGRIDLPSTESLVCEAGEYDFQQGLLQLSLRRM